MGGAPPDIVVSRQSRNWTLYNPIHLACLYESINIVRLLLEHGANVDGGSHVDKTPLVVADEKGSLKILQLLLGSGAQADKFWRGKTALSMAILLGWKQNVSRR